MNYRLIHNNTEVVAIIEATGTTCSNGNTIFEGTIQEVMSEVESLNLTNCPPLSSFV
jgi:hypothetical protein